MARILIVDDVETNRFTLKDIIASMGYQPILTENGQQALKIVERFPVQLIISDIAMPVMDGYELCERIRDELTCPILFLSARTEEKDRVNGFKVGGDDYIIHITSIPHLCDHLHYILLPTMVF